MPQPARTVPLILAGGTGTRLWPVSRDAMPKQFCPLVGQRSSYQQALERVSNRQLFTAPIVMTSADFRFLSRQQAEEIVSDALVVLEPVRRDSAAAIAAGAALARRSNPDAIVLTIATDQVILDTDLFHRACHQAGAAAEAGYIVTFGIRPSAPRTSHGYILPGDELSTPDARKVAAFVERATAESAARYVSEGYLWNSGNIMFRADVLWGELVRRDGGMAEAVEAAVDGAVTDLGFIRLDPDAFARAPQSSVDHEILARTDRAAVIQATFRWSDIGSWDAAPDLAACDEAGNAVRGPVVAVDAAGCVLHAEDRLTAVLGVRDLIVVSTPDAVLVLPRKRAEEVKQLVRLLKQQHRSQATGNGRAYRSWGHYDSIDAGERFKVRRIVVDPGKKLSPRRHMHRAEHWIVVRGAAEVTLGDTVRIVYENESIYISVDTAHRLANPGKIPLELIEVQTGSYLGEDDVVRLEHAGVLA